MVYPGSHRLPVFDFHDLRLPTGFASYPDYERFVAALLDAQKLEPQPLLLRRGQLVIWAANLLHGGSAITDPKRSRLSQATHYFFEGGLYYQPGASDPQVGALRLKHIEEIGTTRRLPNLYRGRSIPERRLRPPGAWRRRLSHAARRFLTRSC